MWLDFSDTIFSDINPAFAIADAQTKEKCYVTEEKSNIISKE